MGLDHRYHERWAHISRHVRSLFNHHCAKCGKDCHDAKEQSDQLQVHHIDENPQNNALENLIPLCSICHLQIEKEARLHAPFHDQQTELFEDNTYFSAMTQMRQKALEIYGGMSRPLSQELDPESFELLELRMDDDL